MSSEDIDEAMKSIGDLPTPAIERAIRTLATLLQPMDERVVDSPENKRISRVRTASMAVLEAMSIKEAEARFLWEYGVVPSSELVAARKHARFDWLGRAMAELEALGVDPGPDPRPMATRYGWDPHGAQLRGRRPGSMSGDST